MIIIYQVYIIQLRLRMSKMSKKIITDDDYEDLIRETHIKNEEKNEEKNEKSPIKNVKSGIKSVITLTFGDMAENHVGMEQLGKMVNEGEGFNLCDLQKIKERFDTIGAETELYNVAELSGVKEIKENVKNAHLLVIRNGANVILKDLGLEYNKVDWFKEQSGLDVDKKAFMYGRVVNKNARWNLCFDEKGQEPQYENGKGRVISFDDIPITKSIVDSFPKYFGEKAENLKGEGNYYYDITKCGIGFHGDSERRKVLAFRLGGDMDLHYQWFKDGESVGKRVKIEMNGGDVYVMSEKSVGTDWKKKKIYTVRHATGCDKFTK